MPAARRRPRGSVERPITPGYKVATPTKDLIASMALAADVSASHFVELMAAHVATELTDQGIPSWMPELNRPEELPITTA